MTAKKKTAKLSFEEGKLSLEGLTAQLGEGKLSLEESIKAYEEGMALVSQLEEQLAQHRRRIEQIDPDTAEIKPFEGE